MTHPSGVLIGHGSRSSSLSASSTGHGIGSRLGWGDDRPTVINGHADPLGVDVDRFIAGRYDDGGFLYRLAAQRLVEAEHPCGQDCPRWAVPATCRADRIERLRRLDRIAIMRRHMATLPSECVVLETGCHDR